MSRHSRNNSLVKSPENPYGSKYKEQQRISDDSCLIQSIKEGQYFIGKRVSTSHFSNQELQHLEQQLEQIKKLSHPNILKLRETIRDKDSIIQIIEYAGEQTLKNQLENQQKPSVSVATQYLLQLLLALDYLNSQQINLQPDFDQIYLSDYGALRLSFNISQKRCEWKDEVQRICEVFKDFIHIDETQSHEVQEIQRILLTKCPSPQFMLNHPYLLKAMHDFYRQNFQKHNPPVKKNNSRPQTTLEQKVMNKNNREKSTDKNRLTPQKQPRRASTSQPKQRSQEKQQKVIIKSKNNIPRCPPIKKSPPSNKNFVRIQQKENPETQRKNDYRKQIFEKAQYISQEQIKLPQEQKQIKTEQHIPLKYEQLYDGDNSQDEIEQVFEHDGTQFLKTAKQDELKEMLEIYKNQLAQSKEDIFKQAIILNLSEIKECSFESSLCQSK